MSAYWKPNIYAVIVGDVSPWKLAKFDKTTRSYFFPEDWKEYDENEVDLMYAEWIERRILEGKAI